MKAQEPSQVEILEAELLAGRELNGIDIMNMNIMNYKGRIFDLRQKYPGQIRTEMKPIKNGKSRIAHYKFIKQGQLFN